MRRRKLPPDNRIPWNDQNLPFYDSKGRPWKSEDARKGFEKIMSQYDNMPKLYRDAVKEGLK